MAIGVTKQQNIAVNTARNLVFFEGSDLCYNYRTGQWTDCTAYSGLGVYDYKAKGTSIGLIRYSSGAVSITNGNTGTVAQTAIITTGATDVSPGLRGLVGGVRPLANGGTNTVRVGVQDDISDSVSWSASTSVNSRTGIANFRSEGRYVRVEVTLAGGFETVWGADVDVTPLSKV